jgi:hypothetical protein
VRAVVHYLLPVAVTVDLETGDVEAVDAPTDRMVSDPVHGAVMDADTGRAVREPEIAARARNLAETGEWPSWP